MSDEMKNVIVIGASGNLGPHIVQELLSFNFTVSVLTRESSKSTFPSSVTVHRTDYSEASLVEIFKGHDAVVSCIATFSTREQLAIVDAACEAKIKRFIPSEYGVDTSPPRIADCLPPAKPKQDTVAHLITKEQDGMTWSAICVGAWFDWVLQVGGGLMGWDIYSQKATIFDSGDQPYEATNLPQIAKAVVSTLRHPAETRNRYVFVRSFTLTQNKVLAGLEKASGKKWQVTQSSTKKLAMDGMEMLGKGGSDGAVEVITAAIYGNGDLNHFGDRAARDNEMLGLHEEDLGKVLGDLVEEAAARA